MASLVIFMLLERRDLRDRLIGLRGRERQGGGARPNGFPHEDGAFVNRLARAADGLERQLLSPLLR